MSQGKAPRPMRRSDRDATTASEIVRILTRARVLFLALHDEPAPYVVPLFFGWEEGRFYLHGAREGTRTRLMSAHPEVGFCAVAGVEIVEGAAACDFTARTESVVGTGTARIVDDAAERIHGLDLIMSHSGTGRPAGGFDYRPGSLQRTSVVAIDIATISAKRIGAPSAGAPAGRASG